MTYLKNGEFVKVATLKTDSSELSKKIAGLELLSPMEDAGYNAQIFLRVKKNNSTPLALR